MSATLQASIIPFPRAGAGLDREGLLRMACCFDRVRPAKTQVVYDEEGTATRFLCRAPRVAFVSREEFIAAAVKRFLGSIEDSRLAEMMYVATLYNAGEHVPVSLAVLRARVAREFGGPVPAPWSEQLVPAQVREAVLLSLDSGGLEFVTAGPRWWTYGMSEG